VDELEYAREHLGVRQWIPRGLSDRNGQAFVKDQTLSASDTAFDKFFGPALLLAADTAFIYFCWRWKLAQWDHNYAPILVLAPSLAALSALMLRNAGIKRVRLHNGLLLVSNYRREIVVRLADVESVQQRALLMYGPVVIRLTRPSAFGRRIVFFPRGKRPYGHVLGIIPYHRPHPIVEQLTTLAREARHALVADKSAGCAS
jgi:hypothetical protein